MQALARAEHERVFGSMSDKKRMRLTHSQMVEDGITILVYEPAARG